MLNAITARPAETSSAGHLNREMMDGFAEVEGDTLSPLK
jgi:hypothetical protein